MTADRVMVGVALIVVPAVGCQLPASRLRVPALLVLLPVGFAAGALTDDVDPEKPLGDAFSPLVSLAVAVILYEAGLGLEIGRLRGHTRRIVVRLVWLGALITWLSAALFAVPMPSMSKGAAVMLGAVLVVSGPTVVGPLLNFVRPSERLRRILVREGTLLDHVLRDTGGAGRRRRRTDPARDLRGDRRHRHAVRPDGLPGRPAARGAAPRALPPPARRRRALGGRPGARAGLDVLMWAGAERQRARIEEAGLALAPGGLLAAASGAGAELEGITGVLLLTKGDDSTRSPP
ncbi:cation:proton antiporter [Streptomyces sp. NPDC058357]|uniref:cation:proton antiporter domain-containing protein n=1 Tax=unclassified Streptomyces TaxID=2593676 RepID=UPI003666852F